MKATQDTTKTVHAVRTAGGLSFRVDARALVVIALLVAAASFAAVVLIGSGDYAMSPGQVVTTLLGDGTFQQEFIVTELRLPRVWSGCSSAPRSGSAAPSSRASPATPSAAPTSSASARAPRSAPSS